MTLNEHAHKLLQTGCIPAGVMLSIDNLTDNLVVTDGNYGFNITHLCLDDWSVERIAADIREGVDDLLARRPSKVCRIVAMKRMKTMRKMSCAFDVAQR